MSKFSRRAIALLGVGILIVAGLAAAAAARTQHTTSISACALLPDTKSSTRYTLFDAPLLSQAFLKGHVTAHVLNAQGDPQRQKSQADACLAAGAKVILLDQLTPASGIAITNDAVKQGAKVIDYDRLVVGSKASYYVSFDNVRVGKLQGQGLVAALKGKTKPVIAELNGALTDNNAHLFKQGYDSILNPLYTAGALVKADAGDQWTNWDPVKASTIFQQILTRNSNKIDGVLAANDGIAGAVIADLKNANLSPIALTGQDATPTGVQYILAGWQSGTVYKSIKLEAAAAANTVIKVLRQQKVTTTGKVSGVPSVLLVPQWITKSNYKILFTDGFLKPSQVCTGEYKQYCG